MKLTDKIEITNEDNMQLMSRYEDNHFDLAIVDPPYGINADKKNSGKKLQSKKSSALSSDFGSQEWDSHIPNDEYFKELKEYQKSKLYGVLIILIYKVVCFIGISTLQCLHTHKANWLG